MGEPIPIVKNTSDLKAVRNCIGIILLREIDGDFRTPAAENLVYQNLPAIALGFPMLLLTAVAPEKPVMVIILLAAYFVVMNVILFRKKIFRQRKK